MHTSVIYNLTLFTGDEYTCLEYCRKPSRRDIGSRVLYRDAHMTGWAYKIVQEADMKFPMVYGEGKRSRLLATIGVTRGFGDHDLRAQSQNGTIYIKPFLSPQPEVFNPLRHIRTNEEPINKKYIATLVIQHIHIGEEVRIMG